MTDLLAGQGPWRTAVLESSLDCVILMDGDGVIVDVNRGTEDTFGVPRDVIIGRRLGDVFVPPELRARHEAGLARYLKTGQSTILGHRIEVEAMRVTGERVPVELSIVQLAGVDPPLFVGHLRDISARLRSERRLRASAAAGAVLGRSQSPAAAIQGVLRAVGEELQWPVVQFWRVDAEADVLALEGSWLAPALPPEGIRSTRSLRRNEGLPGRTWASGAAVWIEDLAAVTEQLPRFAAFKAAGIHSALAFPVHVEGEVGAVIEAFRTSREPRDAELLALLTAIGGQLGHVTAVHEAREAAERANKAKDQFLAMVSHELRTPLGPILGWAQMLQREHVTPQDRMRAAGVILRNAEQQSRLVEDLLDVSRMGTGKMTIERVPVSLVQVVHLALDTSAPAARAKGVEIRFEGDFEVPLILGDQKRLQQVVTNLLTNAVKFTPARGQVSVSLASHPEAVEVVVADSGEGIAPELLPHVFDPFRQGLNHGGQGAGGLGLGLAIVKDLVAAHGGTVTAASAGPGLGATFAVRLPRAG